MVSFASAAAGIARKATVPKRATPEAMILIGITGTGAIFITADE